MPAAMRVEFAGIDREVPLLGGQRRRYVNFDNAATTPPFREVMNTVNRFMDWYSSIHRGTGYKSQLSTEIFDQCRQIVAEFFGIDLRERLPIFCCNTTAAINKLCRRLTLQPGQRVLATAMEHHSNMLPWRLSGEVDYIDIRAEDGSMDLDALKSKLEQGNGAIRLVAVTGASNVTGCMPPLKTIARMAHEHGAQVLVDAAQLAAHRKVDMGPLNGEESIDFLVFSAHKMYAPYGSGGLIGPTEFFAEGPPSFAGGGAVNLVTLQEVAWADPPDLEEAGTPNVVGAVALAKSMQILMGMGMEVIAGHERQLTQHLLEKLQSIDGIRVYGQRAMVPECDRVGVVPILADGYSHGLLAAILGYEYGIGVRHGCFCAHPYLMRLLELTPEQIARYFAMGRSGDLRRLPGFVRISLAMYNTIEEIDYLIESLRKIMKQGTKWKYEEDLGGRFSPEGFQYEFASDFVI